MLFKRRKRPNHLERLRVAVWPRHSFARSARYFTKRVLRLTASPNAIALGFAAGAFASITPFIGLHFLLSFLIAFLIGGNMIAAAFGTAVGNPLTFPMIWASTLGLGRWLLGIDANGADGKEFGAAFAAEGFAALWQPFIKPMLVGGIPLGLVAGLLFYVLTRLGLTAFQARRAARKAQRALARQEALAAARSHCEAADARAGEQVNS